MLAEDGADGLGVEGPEPGALTGDDGRAHRRIVDGPVGQLGDRREVLLLDQQPGGPIVPGTPAAAYAITGTSKCIASRSGTQKPSCSERQRYADARR